MSKRNEMMPEEMQALRARMPDLFDSTYGIYVTAVVALNVAIEAVQQCNANTAGASRTRALAITHAENAKLWLHAYADSLDPQHQAVFLARLDAIKG